LQGVSVDPTEQSGNTRGKLSGSVKEGLPMFGLGLQEIINHIAAPD
jgi:hypothetical protein